MTTLAASKVKGDDDGPVLAKLPREPLHDRVYKELRRALMAARFTPGEQLTLRATAEKMGVSVMPVRAAFNRLVAERAVVLLPNGSVAVPQMSARRFEELVELRATLEGLAVRKAAKAITPAELDALAEISDELTKAGMSGDGELYLDLNKAFKFTIYEASRSPELFGLIEALWLQFGPFMHNYAKDVRAHGVEDCHREVLAALQARDGAAAEKAMTSDISGGAKFLASVATFAP